MVILKILYVLLFIIVAIAGYTILQIKLYGIKLRDFWTFIKAIQDLDVLYRYSKKYDKMSSQEQLIFLLESEKMFKAFEKIPSQVWEDEYDKYAQIVDVYKNIKMLRWAEAHS